jgi:hypothetical protein
MKAITHTISLLAALALCHAALAVIPRSASVRATIFVHKHHPVENHRTPVEAQPDLTGVIPRAISGENPLQILNPLAPAKYWAAEENMIIDRNPSEAADGVKLLSISF